jgi:cytosine/adenosine deaminase-related metal-dependent hydrolase
MRRVLLTSASAALVCAWLASCADQTNGSFPKLPDAEDGGGDDAGSEDGGGVTGDKSRGFLLSGTVIGPSGPFDGQVLVGSDGVIACAEAGTTCEKDPKAEGVARIAADVIAPGLIDTHNHILFDIFDNSDWAPTKTYQNHDDWTKATNEPRYPVMVDVKQCLEDASQGKPTWCPAKFDGAGSLKCEMNKWGELKGLVAGETSIVGLAGSALPCFDGLVRSIDTQWNGLGSDKIQTSALFPPSKTTADGVCRNYGTGTTNAFLIHCGEGIDARSLDEFATLGTVTTTPECLYHQATAVTHGTAFTAAQFATMKQKGMKLTWSPASNVALYGQTTNIPAALDAGVLVSLAPDWSMGGSQNMLDEMRFAKKWSDTKWGGRLKAQDLVTMSTANAATVLGLGDRLGKIAKGYLADIFAVTGDKGAPYEAILAATPKTVRFTMIGGRLFYGDAELKSAGNNGACEDLDVCGATKFVCVADPTKTSDKLNQTFAQVKAALEAAMVDIDQVRPDRGTGPSFAPLAPVVACASK